MKRLRFTGLILLSLMVLTAACTGLAGSQPTATPTPLPPVPTTIPINLAGPPMQIGSTYLYVDGSLLVAVPGGAFIMGHGETDNPIHTVTLSDFWIYSTKVTNAMYAWCVALGKCSAPDSTDNPGYSDSTQGNNPVVGVTFDQASAYCSFVNAALPSEAQWEKTARGPQGNIYPWGNNAPSCDLLNFGKCIGRETPVTNYPDGKSYYSALDMEGNAYEWVADWYKPDYYLNSPANDPGGPDSGAKRSIRSTAFNSDVSLTAAANRFAATPDTHRNDLSFRCVVKDPAFFAPFCQLAAVYGVNSNNGSTNANHGLNCPPLTDKTSSYCQNGARWTNVSLSAQPPSQIDNVSGVGSPNCIPNGSNQWDCKAGTTITASGSCSAQPSGSPACPTGYTYNGKVCVAQGAPGKCVAGYNFDPSLQCCATLPGTNTHSPCPAGTFLNKQDICISTDFSGPASLTITTDTTSCSSRTGGSCNNTCSSCRYGGKLNPVTCTCACNQLMVVP